MREIKFRAKAMSKKSTNWYYGLVRSIAKDGTGFLQDQNRNCVHINIETLGQYTGIKDKNGKEIYEGDIVRYFNKPIDELIRTVTFKYGAFGIEGWYKGTHIIFGNILDSQIEVIGNIYENPELLEN